MLACVLVGAIAQGRPVGSWKTYRAYQNATLVAETPNHVFAVFDGSLLSYSSEDQSVQTYSLENGLNDLNIRFLEYSPAAHALLIVYENSNIDVFFDKNTICNLPELKGKYTVNNVEIVGETAYFSINTGVVLLNLTKLEFKNQYRLGHNTYATCQWNGYQYAATESGMMRVPLSGNLIDVDNWQFWSPTGADIGGTTQMIVFQNHLFLYNGKVFRISPEGNATQLFDGLVRQMRILEDKLAIVMYSGILVCPDAMQTSQWLELDSELRDIVALSAEKAWVAWGTNGLSQLKLTYPDNVGIITYEPLVSQLKINSPLRNNIWDLNVSQGKLLLTGGGKGSNRNNIPGTFSVFDAGVWYNLDYKKVEEQTGLLCNDLLSAVADPRNPDRYFVTSYGEGVYEFEGNDFQLKNLYSIDNSSLQSTLPASIYAENFVRTDGLAFDKNNNLVVANVKNGINVMLNDGSWFNHRYSCFSNIEELMVNRLVVTHDNKKWMNLFRLQVGLFVLDDNGTFDNESDDTFYFNVNGFTDQQNRLVEASSYTSIAEDQNGVVWVGTDVGPITFSSAAQVGNRQCNRLVGSEYNGEGYYILENIPVTAIAVDGINRKWIGTSGSGIFIIDQSDGVKVDNLTTANSFLLSDNISALAIDHRTGEVFIGTSYGLCSYMSDVVEGQPDYSNVHAYPNPVYPLRNSQVVITGLMANSTVKITDLGGNLMKEAPSNGGQFTWNCTNAAGETVKAGVYLVFATQPDGSAGVVTKIVVVK